MSSDPRHRYLEVARLVSQDEPAPLETLEAALYRLLRDHDEFDRDVTCAYDLFRKAEHRSAMDAFVLAKVPNARIATTLEMPISVVEAYGYLFMDVTVFRNRLELQSYAAAYDADDYGKEIVRAAVQIGIEYLTWAFGKGDNSLDNRFVVRQTMTEAYYRGCAHRGNPLTSKTAKEAKQWWHTAIQNAQILEKLDPSTSKNAFDELKIALTKEDDTRTLEQAPVPLSEILGRN